MLPGKIVDGEVIYIYGTAAELPSSLQIGVDDGIETVIKDSDEDSYDKMVTLSYDDENRSYYISYHYLNVTRYGSYDGENCYAIGDIKEAYVGMSDTIDLQETSRSSNMGLVYKFTPETSGSYRFYTSDIGDEEHDTYGYLFDEGGDYLTKDDDGGDDVNFLISYECEAGQTYYIAVYSFSAHTDTYETIFHVEAVTDNTNLNSDEDADTSMQSVTSDDSILTEEEKNTEESTVTESDAVETTEDSSLVKDPAESEDSSVTESSEDADTESDASIIYDEVKETE